ncbi:MAG: DUF1570 domain-containing protein [Planctomycetaceae bacterium]
MNNFRISLLTLCCWLNSAPTVYGAKPIVELTVGDQTYAGRTVAHDDQSCWLLQNDGRLEQLSLSTISKFRKLPGTFASLKAIELRSRLQQEFGREYEVVGTEHYLVCAANGEARAYADLFEETYRTCHHYFRVRNLKINSPEFPLVGIVFSSQKDFAEYMQNEGNAYSNGILGYYSPTTNRTALFQQHRKTASLSSNLIHDGEDRVISPFSRSRDDIFSVSECDSLAVYHSRGTDEGSLADTIIHEATHQVAFNIGVHSRWGQNPRWVVEGLATVFEAPGIRERSTSLASRLNRERFVWFGDYLKNRRSKKSLNDFIADDELFGTATLDAYSQSWALTFYLLETRSSQFSRYLQRLAARSPIKPITEEDRLADFQAEFGRDLDWLDVELERYFTKLK